MNKKDQQIGEYLSETIDGVHVKYWAKVEFQIPSWAFACSMAITLARRNAKIVEKDAMITTLEYVHELILSKHYQYANESFIAALDEIDVHILAAISRLKHGELLRAISEMCHAW